MARKADDAAARVDSTTNRYEPPGPDAMGGGGDGGAERGGPAVRHGEQRSSADVRTALLDGMSFKAKAVQYAAVDGLAIVEGDIVLGTVDEVEQMTEAQRREALAAATGRGATARGVAITGAQFRWPNARVPYEIDPALPNQQRVHDAIAHWQANTPVRLVPRNGEADYVRFVPGGGCSSQVGRRGGRQDITLGNGCTTGNCIHEIGHAVGLWHEQSREDRDAFITVKWANITAGYEHNFNQHISDGDDIGAYDYGSIMHYPRDAFSKNGQDTLVPTSAGVNIGQRTGLSAGDIAAVRQLYPTGPVVNLKKVRDDPIVVGPGVKKLRDDPIVGVKKVRDDVVPAKKLRDDVVVGPPIKLPGRIGAARGGPQLTPFILATPHHAPGYGGEADAGYGAAGDATVGSGEAAMGYLAALGSAVNSAAQTAAELQALAGRAAAEVEALQAEYESVVAQLQQAGLA